MLLTLQVASAVLPWVPGRPDAFDFDLLVEPRMRTIAPGGFTSFIVSVPIKAGAPEEVFVGCTQLFTGASILFDPQYVLAGGRSLVTLRTLPSVPEGTYTITIQGSRRGLAHSTDVTVVVTREAVGLGVSVSPRSISLRRGASAELAVEVSTPAGTRLGVSLDLIGLPRGVTARFSPERATAPGSSTLKVSASPQAQLGSRPVTIKATGQGLTYFDTFTLTIGDGDPESLSGASFGGVLDGYWETTIPESKTPEMWLMPETRRGRYTIDLSFNIEDDGGQAEAGLEGWARMRLEQPSRQMGWEGYTAGMSFDPAEFEGRIQGRVIPESSLIELYWVDPPATTRITYWDRYEDYEPSSYTAEERWPGRLLEALNPISYLLQEGVLTLFADHLWEWEVTPPGGIYGTNARGASGSLHGVWPGLAEIEGDVEVLREDRSLNYSEMMLQAGDRVTTREGSGARLVMGGFDILLDEETAIKLEEGKPAYRTGTDIAQVARREAESYSWKYSLSQPSYLAWLLDAAGNEMPIQWGVGRPKCNIFVANVLHKAGFQVPRHRLFHDPERPETSDPARPIEIYDTSRYTDILSVVKGKGEPVDYGRVEAGDLVVTEHHVLIVTAVHPGGVEVIHCSSALDRIVEETWQLTAAMVVRRPRARLEFSDPWQMHPLGLFVEEGRIRMHNSTRQAVNESYAYLYSPEEVELYTGEVELYTGRVELEEIHVVLEEIYVTLEEIPVHLEEMPVRLIETPLSMIQVGGTDLVVEVAGDGTTTVEMLHGWAKVVPRQGQGAAYLFSGDRVVVGIEGIIVQGDLVWQGLERWWEALGCSPGLIAVAPSPTDSDVYVDGIYRGQGPLLLEVAPGPHSILVRREGCEAFWEVVVVSEGVSVAILAVLAPATDRISVTTHTVFEDGHRYNLTIGSDCVVTRIGLSTGAGTICFLTSGRDGMVGHVNVTLPGALLSGEYVVTAQGHEIARGVVGEAGVSSIAMEFPQGGQSPVSIRVGEASWLALAMAFILFPLGSGRESRRRRGERLRRGFPGGPQG